MASSEAEVILSALEQDTKKYRHNFERAGVISGAAEIFLKNGNKGRAQELQWETEIFSLLTYSGKNAVRRFAPFSEIGGIVTPDISKFTAEQLDYYEKRANETKNSIHKALFSDFLWVSRHNHVFARAAITAYLECINIFYENEWEMELLDAIQRAAELSVSLNDAGEVDRVKTAMLSLVNSFSFSKEFRWCIEPIETILRYKKYMKDTDFEKCVIVAKDGLEQYKSVADGYNIERSFLELLMELMKALKKPQESLKFAYEFADSFVREGDWKLTHYRSGDLVAAKFYQDAARAYQELGDREKTNQLLKKIKEHTERGQENMKEYSFPITVPMKPINDYLEILLQNDLLFALSSLAYCKDFVPDIKAIRSEVFARIGTSVASVLPILSIRDGNPVLRSKTRDEIFEEQVVDRILMDYKVKASIFGYIIDALIEKKGLDADFMVPFLLGTQAFENSSGELLKAGFERYFKADYVSCLHVLVPQIETALRSILHRLGVPTTVLDKDSVQEKLLGTILREEKINLLFGESIVYYLKAVLEDKRGDNLRNDIAHGLISIDNCSKQSANTIFHIFLILASITINHGLCLGVRASDQRALE
ncbi:MAG: DUF4209 domain-containing protein [Candidatus Bathyarchaeia archaeon]|jgi:hypothetical protein